MKSHLVKQLIEIRASTEISRAEIERRAGITCRILNRYEAGESDPRLSVLERWAEALGHRIVMVPNDQP
jgi:transcriptional regulator with XRE-family HTH domain